MDETGFCLTPYVPYAWQESEEIQGLKSQQSKRLNVLGLLNKNNQLESYIFECNINSEIVIKFLDRYVKTIDKLTVVVIDNAPIHRSKAFQFINTRMETEKSGCDRTGVSLQFARAPSFRNILVAYLFTQT